LQYTIDAALDSGVFSTLVVSSDSDAILARAEQLGAVPLKRPAALARDRSPTAEAMMHAMEHLAAGGLAFKTAVLLQPTSPLRTGRHIREACRLYAERPSEMVISVVKPSHHPMKAHKFNPETGFLEAAFAPQYPYMPRQSLPECFHANGAIYVFDTASFLQNRGFPTTGLLPYVMTSQASVDIDTEEDIELVEKLLKPQADTRGTQIP
jgi:CMP-N-acetylneuraminic acid synthetase